MYRSACLSSSPTSSTTEVVPSPVMSSCAVAALAIMAAVGCDEGIRNYHLGEEDLAILGELNAASAVNEPAGCTV
ncbi:hypothetical protein BC936DRAFT_136943 [Jimgerdemannia flammicorona]|uniref:Uncharacterized protein n=1 Tax=Jimgerdemannia flammicorona TaxID=994334 RepID=A0A433CYE6_9FUNG|nr:hypothetical protein BC936DRAFT_136943 [Jimgerdemannia flammicorona]